MLKTLYLHLTSRCNLHCCYCYIPHAYNELPVESWLGFLRQATVYPPDKIVLTGGEPFLYPGLFEMAGYCAQSMPKTLLCLMTNGTFISEENADRLTVFNEIRISADGGAARTDALRGEGCTHKVRRALGILSRRNIKVTASVTTLPEGPQTDELIRQVSELGFTNIRMHPLIRIGRGADYPEDMVKTETTGESCGAGKFLNIMPDGSAYPCHALIRPEFLLGNIQADSYADICAVLAEWEQSRFPIMFTGGCIGKSKRREEKKNIKLHRWR